MSTILRSLKKLENEKDRIHGGYEQTLHTPLGTPRQDMQRAVNFAWLRTKFFRWGIMAFCAIIGVAGLYAYTRPVKEHDKLITQAANSVDRNPAQSRPNFTPAREMPHSGPATNRAYSIASRSHSSIQPEGASQHQTSRPAPSMSLGYTNQSAIAEHSTSTFPQDHFPQAQGIVPTRPPSTPDTVPRSLPAGIPGYQDDPAKLKGYVPSQPADSTPDLGTPRLPAGRVQPPQPATKNTIPTVAPPTVGAMSSRSATSSGAAMPAPDTAAPSEPTESMDSIYANAERMTDGRLKVQAIVWAEIPDDRMAVVNSRIVREGGTIEGFSIVGIGEDAIYVKEGTAVMKVSFGGP